MAHRFSCVPRVSQLSTYAPTACGLATFSAALSEGLSAIGSEVSVVRVADGSPGVSARVSGELVNDSAPSVAASWDLLNRGDIAIIHHDWGIYGGREGDELVDIMDGLRIPSIVVAHSVPQTPTGQQRSVLALVAERAHQLVVMSSAAQERLCREYGVNRRKIVVIPHGATIPKGAPLKRSGRPTLLTWGLLRPGKGIERVIDAMGALRDLPGRPRYLIAGQTHPKVLAADGEAYRDACIERAQSLGVADSVSFDARYRSVSSLSALAQTSAAVVLPYDSTDQDTSGVLMDAVASGRPVVATAFPHAVELLSSGAGLTVSHDDPAALTTALRRVLTEPRLAGAMAAEARTMAPRISWRVVSESYYALAQRILSSDHKALV
ncbi:MAG: glycosyltransferase [Mycobacterium sp.]